MSSQTPSSLQSPHAAATVEVSAGAVSADLNPAQWFAEHVQPHGGQLKSYLRNAYPTVRDVDDVVQESYLRVWRRHATKPITSAKNFLFSVARNLAIDLVRREKTSPINPASDLAMLSVMDDSACTVESTCTDEEVALLLEAIDSLPRRCREIMILRKLEGRPQREIAQLLGLSVQTVQVQIGRGTRRCEALLRSRGVIEEAPL